ncbi:hypothetical protein [Actinoallomurus sp. CA-150999]|uniref:hypothetical protein n=1 Tax=Actinoallomurus sp. CA-150999 TaxID=3239887 RepID=UPI003D8BCE50
MTHDNAMHDGLHQAMHRLPGFPDHDQAEEINRNRPGRIRAVKMNAAGRGAAQRWSTDLNAAGAITAARLNANVAATRAHAKPPRVLLGVQEFIARVFGQGE